MMSMERSHKRPRSSSEHSSSAIKRSRVGLAVAPFSFEQQDIISKASSTLQVPSQDLPRAFGQSSPFAHLGEAFYLTTQEPEQNPPFSSAEYCNPHPGHFIQPPATGTGERPAYNLASTAAMYGPANSCLPDKSFGFVRNPIQWADCFAGFIPIRQALTNQSVMTGEYHDRSETFDSVVTVPEKPFSQIPSPNSHPFQPYSDDPSTQISGPVAHDQGGQFYACDGIASLAPWQSRYPVLQPVAVERRQPLTNRQNMTYGMELPRKAANIRDRNAFANIHENQRDHTNQIYDSNLSDTERKDEHSKEIEAAECTATRRDLGPPKRKPFKKVEDRVQTAQTRKDKACLRCRMQKVRCFPDPSDPQGVCLTCQKVTSMKFSTLPCVRYKITDIQLSKPGQVPDLEWTKRWLDMKLTDITEWKSPATRDILTTEGFSSTPLKLEVREFVPQNGDVLERHWHVGEIRKSVKVPCYAIANVKNAQTAYHDYINEGGAEFFKGCLGGKDELIKMTYSAALVTANDSNVSLEERELLKMVLRLWIAIRMTTRSTRIRGEDTLGMSPDIFDETSPLHGEIPIPPVMAIQIDLILIQNILKPLRKSVLDKLQSLILLNKPSTWFTRYLCLFILLHNCALITEHDASYAKKYFPERTYARPRMVEAYHTGANVLLAHWHYCNKGSKPFAPGSTSADFHAMSQLNPSQTAFVRKTSTYVQANENPWKSLEQNGAYEDDYYFVSQLFEPEWKPRFSRII